MPGRRLGVEEHLEVDVEQRETRPRPEGDIHGSTDPGALVLRVGAGPERLARAGRRAARWSGRGPLVDIHRVARIGLLRRRLVHQPFHARCWVVERQVVWLYAPRARPAGAGGSRLTGAARYGSLAGGM